MQLNNIHYCKFKRKITNSMRLFNRILIGLAALAIVPAAGKSQTVRTVTVGTYNRAVTSAPINPGYTESEGAVIYLASQLTAIPQGSNIVGLQFLGLSSYSMLQTEVHVYGSETSDDSFTAFVNDEDAYNADTMEIDTARMTKCFRGKADFNYVGYFADADSTYAESHNILSPGPIVDIDFTNPLPYNGGNLKLYFFVANPLMEWTATYVEADTTITDRAIGRWDDYKSDWDTYRLCAQPLMVLKITEPSATGITRVAVKPESQDDGNTYNIAGQKVAADYKGIVIRNGKKFIQK